MKITVSKVILWGLALYAYLNFKWYVYDFETASAFSDLGFSLFLASILMAMSWSFAGPLLKKA